MGLWDRLVGRLFAGEIERRVSAAVKVIDDDYWRAVGVTRYDPPAWERQKANTDTLALWRDNPLARRLVGVVTDYVVGDGFTVSAPSVYVQGFVERFWLHPQNRMSERLPAWCDELTRAGELFIVLSRNAGDGMSYVRLLPAAEIERVVTDPDDYERELSYVQVSPDGVTPGRVWPAAEVAGPDVDQVMLHLAVNRPAGAVRGVSDLSAVAEWVQHYTAWLSDRVRVNRLKSAFVWKVTITGASGALLAAKRSEYGQVPSPGSVIVTNEAETWEAVQPKIDADAVEADGKAIRLMSAAGMSVPLHFLSEGESATRATAQEMGDPTWRHFRRRQRELMGLIVRLLTVAYRRSQVAGGVRVVADLQLTVEVPEIVQSDNESLGRAARMMVEALVRMREQGWIDSSTAAAMAFKAAGEALTERQVADILAAATAEGAPAADDLADGEGVQSGR